MGQWWGCKWDEVIERGWVGLGRSRQRVSGRTALEAEPQEKVWIPWGV